MGEMLAAFLAGREPSVTDEVAWSDSVRLERSAYFGDALPPLAHVSSARAVVTRGPSVLVVQDRDGTRHILPGGRLEDGESPETALRREIAEEVGWLVRLSRPVGFLHFRHLTPKPPGYRYPYPVFLQAVYLAEADRRAPELMLEDDYVVGAEFLAVEEACALPLTPMERVLLDVLRRTM